MVIVSPVGKSVVALDTAVEDQEAVVARLLTTTTLFPTALPEAAEAVTMLEFDDVTDAAARGPVKLLSDCMSLSRLVASVWRLVSADVWFCSTVCWDSQLFSGASAAVMDALTADVTSIPGVDAPVAASRISLRSVALDDPSSEFNAESELISFASSSKRNAIRLACPG
jgi:hypothetical protein